ncbi:MAG TPA: hypothetical protein VF183_14340 [Acidimicrobiales bacterium]
MPWCEPCGKFYNPNTLRPDGTCPNDHQVVDSATAAAQQEESAKVPWHLWVLVVGVVVYLGWRLVQLILMLF